ncbi:hypothetical protein [Lapillicoccus jejuensis]|uniref:Uncharacterized protein n=1 Tax=Lapillicoccus jejuensis TaxID=402171 RepID=A0A542DZ72_9MICO|nr:hypothetical protein [Lapillicoccus jejuensis]TQJ08388.1 hypothetical protein FB458_1476 [Lapillicoccus jejuensis]
MRWVASALITLGAAYWVGAGSAGLPTLPITLPDVLPVRAGPGGPWLLTALVVAVGMVLTTSRRALRVDPGPLVVAVWTCLWWAFWAPWATDFEFSGPDRRCVYADCWPRTPQQWAVGAPLLVACVVLAALSVAPRRTPLWVRVTVPAGVFLALTVVQAWAWGPYVVPYLATPPG